MIGSGILAGAGLKPLLPPSRIGGPQRGLLVGRYLVRLFPASRWASKG